MTANHGLHAGRYGVEVQLVQVMQNKDRDAFAFDQLVLRQLHRPGALVDIAAHGDYVSDGAQLIQNSRIANIPGVKDELRSLERLYSLRPQEAVRVGNYSDPH